MLIEFYCLFCEHTFWGWSGDNAIDSKINVHSLEVSFRDLFHLLVNIDSDRFDLILCRWLMISREMHRLLGFYGNEKYVKGMRLTNQMQFFQTMLDSVLGIRLSRICVSRPILYLSLSPRSESNGMIKCHLFNTNHCKRTLQSVIVACSDSHKNSPFKDSL